MMSSSPDAASTVSYCSPKRFAQFKRYGTCFTVAELRTLATSYNRAIKRSTGPLARTLLIGKKNSPVDLEYAGTLDESQERDYLQHALRQRLRGVQEHAWADLLLHPDSKVYEVVQAALRPRLPASWLEKSHQWLSTLDIEAVMFQYEEAYPDFKFLGVFPIDFDVRRDSDGGHCIADEMCLLTVAQLAKRGITQFAAVINMDEHDQPGSHWVAVYGCLDPESINFGMHYFDSVANPTPEQIQVFMKRVAAQMARHAHVQVWEVPLTRNDVQLQFKSSECGIFTMYFTACCVSKSIPVKQVWQAMAQDELIHMLRGVFYRPPPGVTMIKVEHAHAKVRRRRRLQP